MNAIGGGQPFLTDGFTPLAQGNRQSPLAEERQYNGALRNMAEPTKPVPARTQVCEQIERVERELLVLSKSIEALQCEISPLLGNVPDLSNEAAPHATTPERRHFPEGTACHRLQCISEMLQALTHSLNLTAMRL